MRSTGVGPLPIWVLVVGVVLLLAALGPSFVPPAATSPVRPASAISTASSTHTGDR